MASKYQLITAMYEEVCKEVARDKESWKELLATAGSNYKLRFDEQLLIFAQRPDATAVLEIEKWNNSFDRWVKKGTKGIAVFNEQFNGRQKLKYYFDVSDTHEGRNPKSVPIWNMKPEYEEDVIEALEGVYGKLEDKSSLQIAIMSAAQNGAEDHIDDYFRELLNCKAGSFLEDLDEDNLIVRFRETAAESVGYLIGKRLGQDFENSSYDFQWLSDFNTKEVFEVLGCAVSDIAEMGLREIANSIRVYEKSNHTFEEKKLDIYNYEKEKEGENDEYNLHGKSRRNDSGFEVTKPGRSDSWSLGNEKEELPSERETDNILQSSDIVQVERTSATDRARSGRDDAKAYRSDESEGEDQRRTEGEISDAVDTGDEQYQTESKGDRTEGTHIQLEYFDRGAEDRSLPFFHIDKVAEAVRSFFDEDILQEIELFYRENNDEGSRITFLKEKFSGLPEKEALGYGCKLYSNVLFLYEGEQGRPQSGAYYDWRVIEECLEGLMLTGAFYSEIDPRSFTFSQEIIDIALTSGSLYENGKFRIYEQFQKSLSEQENIAFLKQEYGIGGSSDIKEGTRIGENHNSKGIELHRGYGEDAPRFFLKWKDVCRRIGDLIKINRYLNAKELSEYPRWLERQEEKRAQKREEQEAQLDRSDKNIHYEYHLGDTVYLGALQYELLEITEDSVKLFDENCPLINKELPIEVFERRMRETPANDHLIAGDKQDAAHELSEKEEIEKTVSEEDSSEQSLKADIVPLWERADSEKNVPKTLKGEKKDYRIASGFDDYRTKKERFADNINAIELLRKLRQEGRFADTAEQEVLAKYVGWGGIPEAFDEVSESWRDEYIRLKELLTDEEYSSARESTLTAFYTPKTVIDGIYKVLENMGFKQGNILEPSCGVGNFIGCLPDSMRESRIYGIELDKISGSIAKQLYQNASIAVDGYENTKLPDSFFDVAIGNVPFGDFKVSDPKYNKYNWLIHDYFFGKTLDKVRPGGIIAFVTAKGTMDKTNNSVRRYLAERADLLGAIRLPDNTFNSAGTEVTSDILFLQKRDRMVIPEQNWVYLSELEDGIKINSYFADNPEMILGEMKMISGRFGPEASCVPFENADLDTLLSEAVSGIHGEISDYETDEMEEEEAVPADPEVRNFSFTVADGAVYFRENSMMYPVKLSDTDVSRVKGMIRIRNSVRRLIELQTEDVPEEEIKEEQGKLNALYDTFTKKYGLINSRANSSAFSEDSSYCLLSALEVIDENGNLIRKADMFSKRTISPARPVARCDTASEALAVAIGEKAFVDMPFMSELTGKEETEIYDDLKGVIFLNPKYELGAESQKYLTADEYLSGNVREKLRVARSLAENNPGYRINVEHLENVQPQDLNAGEISVRLGATWIPEEVISEFIFELLSTPKYAQWNIHVHYSNYTGEWRIEGKNSDRGNVSAYSTYGTKRINAYRIIEETLNLKDVRIFDYLTDGDGKKKAVLNKKETAIAQGKQELIKQAFSDWIWKDSERRQYLTERYNQKFNSIRPREYDGSHIVFAGMNPEIVLRKHQRNAVARILYGGNTLLAHAVGAGKTFEMAAAAMESKRLGLCSKSMFVVPNHLTEQWASEFLQLYPSANILVATKKDFQKRNRKRFCGRVATGDYDAVIIGHSQFEKIPVSEERQRKILEEQIEEITAGIAELKNRRGERFSIKALEKSRKKLKVKLEKLNDQSKKDDLVTFEELGVDRLFIDESHYYKNLYLYTKMRNVGGIAQTEAFKSSDLFMKCRYLDEVTGGKGIVFATGTPISNSMTELYTIQRYLQYDMLQRNDLQHFDAWASTFGETVTAIELAPEGSGYRSKTRFAKFYNLPELMAMFKEVADIQTEDMLKLPVPKANYHNVAVKPSDFQKKMVEELSERAERVRNKMVDPSKDNMLKITNDGRKLALDQRLENETLPDFEGSKVNACVDNIFKIWEKGKDQRLTQLVFCDLSTPKDDGSFNIYDDIRDKLTLRGVPQEEIKYIHEANTEARKMALFSQVRQGAVRILIGSTQKMGAGTNVQNKLVAIHDIDCPWRPSDLEQRSGRIIRQGNENEEVEIFRYVTEETFDAYLYQLVENKQKFISQVMTGKSPVRSAEDFDEAVLSYAEIKMLATGNPHIKEKMDLDIQVSKLKLLKQNFLSEKYSLEDRIERVFPAQIKYYEEQIQGFNEDIAFLNSQPSNEKEFAGMLIKGENFVEKAQAGERILQECKAMKSPDPVFLGEYRGFNMELSFDTVAREFMIILKRSMQHTVKLGNDASGNIIRIDHVLSGIEKRAAAVKEEYENVLTQLDKARIETSKTFEHEDELKEKSARLDELNILLNLDEKENTVIDVEPEELQDVPDREYER